MKFSEIIGHKNIIDKLKKTVDSGKLPHAILLSGKSGIGKMRVARAFAQYLHCQNKINGDSCGVCPSCLQHQKLNNPDTHYIFPIIKKKEGASISNSFHDEWAEMLEKNSYMSPQKWNDIIKAGNTQPVIYVTESENIILKASLSAYQENYKIFIIWQPEKMRIEAANKLLKILEEPFEDTIFILVSNESSKILPTIYSRTRPVNLLPLSKIEISQYLSSLNIVEPSEIETLSRLSEGSISRAIDYASDSKELNEFSNVFKEMMRMCYALKAKNMKEISEFIASMGREKLIRFLTYSSRMLRENFIYNMRIIDLNLMTPEEEEFGKRFSPFIHAGNIEGLTEEISKAISDIERNANAKIVMFDLLFLIARLLKKENPK